MNQPDQNYDIHEKISQLETELLQHELLIRRQKHVINSLKQIISPASPAGGAPTAGSVVRGANSTQNARAPLSQAAQILATLPSTTSVSGRNPAPAATVARAPAVQTTARSVPTVSNIRGPAVRQKKRSALAKVVQFCTKIPKFGSAVPKKRKSSGADLFSDLNNAGGSSSSNKRRRSAAGGDEGEEGEEQDEQDALFDSGISVLLGTAPTTAPAPTTARGALQSAGRITAAGAGSGAASTQATGSRAAGGSNIGNSSSSGSSGSAASVPASQAAAAATAARLLHTTASIASVTSSQRASAAAEAASAPASKGARASTSALSCSEAAGLGSTQRVAVRPGTVSPTPSSSSRVTTATAPVTNVTATATATTSVAAPSTPQHQSTSTGLSNHRNLLSSSAHKSVDIVDHCKRQARVADRLEIVRDLHSSIQSNPRRLQHLLDSAGGRDLCLSWLQQSMDRLSAAYLAASTNSASSASSASSSSTPSSREREKEKGVLSRDEEVELTKLIEYCVLLVNQAYWDAKSVSELRFDKTLKNLYRLFEFKTEAHHATVSAIVKSIWPSYRIMRKQHEGKSKGSAVLIQ